MTEQRAHCRNCGEALVGPYCSNCGQREDRGDLTFAGAMGEVADELFSWDSRLWRTLLPLVFRPGYLTAEFIAHRRARYVPPFRLYLIISFVLFLVLSVLASEAKYVVLDSPETGDYGISVSTDRERVESLVDEVIEEQTASDGEFGQIALGEGQSEGDSGTPLVVVNRVDEESPKIDLGISLADENSPQWLRDLNNRIEDNADKLSTDPGGFVRELVEYLPQMMFLLLPVFALILQFCYLFSPFHYLQHLVFALHFHSFVYLLYLVRQLTLFWVPDNAIAGALPFAVLLYLPLALRRAYGSVWGGAIAKTLFIVVTDTVTLALGFAGSALLALALM